MKFNKLMYLMSDLLSDQSPSIDKRYVQKLEKMLQLFKDIYIKPQLGGKDKLAALDFRQYQSIQNEGEMTEWGFYDVDKKKVVLNLRNLFQLNGITFGLDPNGDSAAEREMFDSFFKKRNSSVFSLIMAIIHEYRHFFQDKYVVLADNSPEGVKDLSKIEKFWKVKGFIKNHEQVYGSIINPEGKNPAEKMREAFEYADAERMLEFARLYTTINGQGNRHLAIRVEQINSFSYVKALHEKDARKSEVQTMLNFRKDVLSYSKSEEDAALSGNAKRMAGDVAELINAYVAEMLRESKAATEQIQKVQSLMRSTTAEDVVLYGQIVAHRGGEEGEKSFEKTMSALCKLGATAHLFTAENLEKIEKLMKEKNLERFLPAIQKLPILKVGLPENQLAVDEQQI